MPKKQPDKASLHVIVPAELKARIEVMAKARRRSQNAEAILALEARAEEFEAKTAEVAGAG